ncbi:hypothetical protein GCM10011586_36450 [Silvibacterium dinghuense]|nr:hypothetical protein GCM10011586_36450 [Silvibacterium dinghuense]
MDVERRRELMERVLASDQFRRAPRLSAFLRFICEQERLGLANRLNEQRVGVHVFGRPEGYHVGDDSIVRSQARQLRQRLEEYFATEGKDEPFVLSVPKGSYVPHFDPYPQGSAESESAEELLRVGAGSETGLRASSSDKSQVESLALPQRRWSWGFQASRLMLGGALVWILALIAFLGYQGFRYWTHTRETKEAIFWDSLLSTKREVIIVPSDSSLVLLEKIDDKRVALDDYMSHRYLNGKDTGDKDGYAPPDMDEVKRSIAFGRYTNMADLNLAWNLGQLAGARHTQAHIRFARDLNLKELGESNSVLIGGPRSNPWVDLYAPYMDFVVDYDQSSHRNVILNRKPKTGEQARYFEVGGESEHEAYGIVAYLPGLDGQGSSLLVGGTSRAGTEAATEFLFSHGFSSLLERISSKQGIPHFEILISTRNLRGDPHESSVLCYHQL